MNLSDKKNSRRTGSNRQRACRQQSDRGMRRHVWNSAAGVRRGRQREPGISLAGDGIYNCNLRLKVVGKRNYREKQGQGAEHRNRFDSRAKRGIAARNGPAASPLPERGEDDYQPEEIEKSLNHRYRARTVREGAEMRGCPSRKIPNLWQQCTTARGCAANSVPQFGAVHLHKGACARAAPVIAFAP